MYEFINLNEHSEYVKLLDIIAKKTKYIEYVIIDSDDTKLLDCFEEDIMFRKNTNKWWGTKISQSSTLYKIKASSKLFTFLKKFETFCIQITNNFGDCVQFTDFGINDIAFFDDKTEPILFTTTHEGNILLREDIKF